MNFSKPLEKYILDRIRRNIDLISTISSVDTKIKDTECDTASIDKRERKLSDVSRRYAIKLT